MCRHWSKYVAFGNLFIPLWIRTESYGVGMVTVPIEQMRKLRDLKMKELGSTKLTRFFFPWDFSELALCSCIQWHSRKDLKWIMLLFPTPSYHQTWSYGSLRAEVWPTVWERWKAPRHCGLFPVAKTTDISRFLSLIWVVLLLRIANLEACASPAGMDILRVLLLSVPTVGGKKWGQSEHPKEGCGKNVTRNIPSLRNKCHRSSSLFF